MKQDSIELFRPMGQAELDLVKESDWRRFPPRLPEQPIFYPVVNYDYARKIAKDWNAKQEGVGHVVCFRVDSSFLNKYDTHKVGSFAHQEYWIPAEELNDFNDAITTHISLLCTYRTWDIYILKCADDTLYTGITNNLDKRIEQHNRGKGAKYTRGRGPVTLIKSFRRFSKTDALKLEYKIKQLSREEKLKFQDV